MMDRFQWVRSKAEGKILEVGSAGGHLFRGSGLDIHYVDINEYPLPNFTVADAHNLPFPDNSFTTVSVCELLEHVRDPLQVLKEAARVASTKVIFTVPFEYLWTADKLPLMTVEERLKETGQTREEACRVGDPTVIKINSVEEAFHRRWFTRASLEELLSQLGLPYSIELLEYDGWAYLVGEIKAAPSNVFDNPDYWCGELGYRPHPTDGTGYRDFPVHRVKVNHIISKKPGKVLDVGCAFGYIVQRLRRKGVEAWGIDISHYALAQAPEEVKPYLVHGSADTLPWPDQFFDMVVSFSTLEHLSADILPKAISEIKRVSKRGVIAVGPSKPSFDDDITHQVKKPLSWWRSQFPPEFEVRDDANEEWTSAGLSIRVALLSTPFFTVPPHNYGGLERIVYDLAYGLAQAGHQVTVFAPDGSHVEDCEMVYFGPPIEKVHVNWLEAEVNAVNVVAQRIMNDGYNIIHGQNWFGFEYALKAQRPELKTCHTHHGHLNSDWWGRSKPPFALNLIALSNWMQRVYASQGFNAKVCVDGSTKILTYDGSLIPIKDIVDRRMGLPLLGIQDGHITPNYIIDYQEITNHPKYILRLETLSKSLQITPDNAILTISGWKNAEDIKIGDFIYGTTRNSLDATRNCHIEGLISAFFTPGNHITAAQQNLVHDKIESPKARSTPRQLEIRDYKASTTRAYKDSESLPSRSNRWRGPHFPSVSAEEATKESCLMASFRDSKFRPPDSRVGKEPYSLGRFLRSSIPRYKAEENNNKDASGRMENSLYAGITTSLSSGEEKTSRVNNRILPVKSAKTPPTLHQKRVADKGRDSAFEFTFEPVTKIEILIAPDKVYDLTTNLGHFFANGILIHNCYNGIPIEEYGFKAKKGDRLLFVGRLDSFKRPHIAIEVAKKAGLGLDIAGGTFVYDTAYMESIKQACDGEQIRLYENVPMEPKVKLYQNAKAVIFPSEMGEPFGLIVPEANATGTAVIASRDGAIPETIEEGVTGFVCDSVDEMVEAIGKVDQIKPEACRERAERLFSREAMAKNYVEAYQGILRGDEW